MKQLTLDEVKGIELDILKFIHTVCVENNLRYYASYGTLIGAIRHNGFIPWDDDIDIYMPRNDYNEFKKLIKNYDQPYILKDVADDVYYHSYSKLSDSRTVFEDHQRENCDKSGVWVDIFILDGLPDDIKKAKKHCDKCHKLTILLYEFTNRRVTKSKGKIAQMKSFMVWFWARILYIFRLDKLVKKMYIKASQKYMYNGSKWVFPEGCSMGSGEIYSIDVFEPYKEIEFEDTIIRVPNNYEECLTRRYGDYMKLPPKQDQVPKHDFTAYWK